MPDKVRTSESTPPKASETVCVIPLVGCLNASEQILGPGRSWVPTNDEQRRFLELSYHRGRAEVHDLPELESIVSFECSVINDFLSAHGFSIRLEPFLPSDFGIASVLKVLVEWMETGEVTTVCDGRYPAVTLKSAVSFYRAPGTSTPIVVIPTKPKLLPTRQRECQDIVCMAVLDDVPSGLDLIGLCGRLNPAREIVDEYDGVVFPMISYDSEVDISWVKGLYTHDVDGQPAIISQALQQTKFRMNEVGAKVESAAATVTFRGCAHEPQPAFVIDKPFLLWIIRQGLAQPLFAGYFCEDVWQNPKPLS